MLCKYASLFLPLLFICHGLFIKIINLHSYPQFIEKCTFATLMHPILYLIPVNVQMYGTRK